MFSFTQSSALAMSNSAKLPVSSAAGQRAGRQFQPSRPSRYSTPTKTQPSCRAISAPETSPEEPVWLPPLCRYTSTGALRASAGAKRSSFRQSSLPSAQLAYWKAGEAGAEQSRTLAQAFGSCGAVQRASPTGAAA